MPSCRPRGIGERSLHLAGDDRVNSLPRQNKKLIKLLWEQREHSLISIYPDTCKASGGNTGQDSQLADNQGHGLGKIGASTVLHCVGNARTVPAHHAVWAKPVEFLSSPQRTNLSVDYLSCCPVSSTTPRQGDLMAFPFLETSPKQEFLSLFNFSLFCNNSSIGSLSIAVKKKITKTKAS